MNNRKEIEDRILHIILYIDKEKTLKPLIGTLKFFSINELRQLKIFFEEGNYEVLYKLVDTKIKEYLSIIEKIKYQNIKNKTKLLKLKEEKETKEDNIVLTKLLEF